MDWRRNQRSGPQIKGIFVYLLKYFIIFQLSESKRVNKGKLTEYQGLGPSLKELNLVLSKS